MSILKSLHSNSRNCKEIGIERSSLQKIKIPKVKNLKNTKIQQLRGYMIL
jgi:hypothetical protein